MSGDEYRAISPARILSEIAEAVPEDCRGSMIFIGSPFDLEQAHHTCANGLLASMPPTIEAFAITARRLIADAIEPLERFR